MANPLGAVIFSFEKAIASGADPSALNGKDRGAVDLFRDAILDRGALSEVPVLNTRNVGRLQPNMLVRFRGMIQDMLGNEFYAGAFKVLGLNSWADESSDAVIAQPIGSTSEQREKRSREKQELRSCGRTALSQLVFPVTAFPRDCWETNCIQSKCSGIFFSVWKIKPGN